MVVVAHKVYFNFEEFYPFYLSQHQDRTCRLLHFFGTSLILFLFATEPRLILCLLISTALGLLISQATPTLEHGIIDMASMVVCFITLAAMFTGKWSRAALALVVGYGFAWTGHFFYELNRPATFTYPALSLMGDFMLWYQIVTLQLKP